MGRLEILDWQVGGKINGKKVFPQNSRKTLPTLFQTLPNLQEFIKQHLRARTGVDFQVFKIILRQILYIKPNNFVSNIPSILNYGVS